MRKFSFLLFFVFSPIVFNIGKDGNPEKGKQKEVVVKNAITQTEPKDSLQIAIAELSEWQVAKGTYYDPKDSNQTKPNPDGIGSFGRMIKSGSIAIGSEFDKFFLKGKEDVEIFLEIKNINIQTPYGKSIFRMDDIMSKKFDDRTKYYLDLYEGDVSYMLRQKGRFPLIFRIYKIRRINRILASE